MATVGQRGERINDIRKSSRIFHRTSEI